MTYKYREIEIQEKITDYLLALDISPFSVIFTQQGERRKPLLSITFFFHEDLSEILNKLDYKHICDKSEFIIFDDTNTLILTGNALINFVDML